MIGAGAGGRPRRPSILEAGNPAAAYLATQQGAAGGENAAQQQAGAAAAGGAGGANSRARARTNSTTVNGVGGGNPAAAAAAAAEFASGAGAGLGGDTAELQNARAVEVLDRVTQKLTGRDFKANEELEVVAQVNKLIIEATKLENLCQHYIGWCSFW